MTNVSQILAGIKATLASVLGSSYGEMPYNLDPSQNNFNHNNNKYAAVASASVQTDTVTKFVTVNQSFEIVITKAFIDDGISDSDKQTKTTEAQDAILDVYQDLATNRAGVPSLVLNVTDLSVLSAEYLDEENVVIIRASFNVLYRFSI